jgi:uncharacterized protein
LKFDWDGKKRQINLQRHGIDFSEANEVFNNPMLSEIDTRHYDEESWIGLGLTHKFVVLVVYTDQGEEKTRIISIRKATKREGICLGTISFQPLYSCFS